MVGGERGVGDVVDTLVGVVGTKIEATVNSQLAIGIAREKLAALAGKV
jgi:hypothetical protein